MKYYKNCTTGEEVEDGIVAEEYVFSQLGLEMKPKGQLGMRTLEQDEFMEELIDWYFSGNWVEKEKPDEEERDLWAEKQDEIYEDQVTRRLLGEDY